MDKTKLAIAGAVSALLSTGQAANAAMPADPAPPARSFAELLAPIPGALEGLPVAQAIDATRAADGGDDEPLVIDGVLRGPPPPAVAAEGGPDAQLILARHGRWRPTFHRRHVQIHRRHIVTRAGHIVTRHGRQS